VVLVNRPTSDDLTEIDSKPGAFWMGWWRNVQMIVWVKGATLDVVERMDRAAIARGTDAAKASVVHLITPDAGPPQSDARDALVEVTRRHGGSVACAGVVIERSGLMGMAVRSAVTGLIIVAPKHYRVKVFDSIDLCAPWICEQHERVTGAPLVAAELVDALNKARAIALPG
jgi:hypothetical protein